MSTPLAGWHHRLPDRLPETMRRRERRKDKRRLQKRRHVERKVENSIPFGQVFRAEDVGLAKKTPVFPPKLVKGNMLGSPSALDFDRMDVPVP